MFSLAPLLILVFTGCFISSLSRGTIVPIRLWSGYPVDRVVVVVWLCSMRTVRSRYRMICLSLGTILVGTRFVWFNRKNCLSSYSRNILIYNKHRKNVFLLNFFLIGIQSNLRGSASRDRFHVYIRQKRSPAWRGRCKQWPLRFLTGSIGVGLPIFFIKNCYWNCIDLGCISEYW